MARNKIALQYFPVDVDIVGDTKIKRLTRKYARGLEFYIRLLGSIYGDKGYYLCVDGETWFDLAVDMHLDESEVVAMAQFCISPNVDLFSGEMLARHGILTSRGVQTTYVQSMLRLKRICRLRDEYRLVSDDAQQAAEGVHRSAPARGHAGSGRRTAAGYSGEQSAESSERSSESSEQCAAVGEESALGAEQRPADSPRKRGEQSKGRETNIQETLSFALLTAAQRENLMKVLLFEKQVLAPQGELERFCTHYDKTGWVDVHGNAIRSRLAALKAWSPRSDAVRCAPEVAGLWKTVYDAVGGVDPDADRTVMLTDFRGVAQEQGGVVIYAARKELVDFLESPGCIGGVRAALERRFGDRPLIYRVPRG